MDIPIPLFEGGVQDVNPWIVNAEDVFRNDNIHQNVWPVMASAHLSAAVESCLVALQATLTQRRGIQWVWIWATYSSALRGIQSQVTGQAELTIVERMRDTRARHPKACAAAVGAAIAGGAIVLAPVAVLAGLEVIGFSAVGPVAGSFAAFAQSVFYGGAVQAGSAFALAQSAAMGGVVAPAIGAQVAGASAAAAGVIAANARAGRPPSRTWTDGVNFVACQALIDELLAMNDGH